MKLRHKSTGLQVTVSYPVYRKKFYEDPDWVDITPPPTAAQLAIQDKFIKLGKLHRTKSNLQEIIRTFGDHHGLFTDAITQLDKRIKLINSQKP